MLRLFTPLLLAALVALPAAAQDDDSPLGQGLDRLLENFRRDLDPLLRDFAEEVEPQLRGLVTEMGPLLATLAELIGDIENYHAPEKLPNGDIVIRRKDPSEMLPGPDVEPAPEGQIDL